MPVITKVYGFTGTRWVIPVIDGVSTEKLLDLYAEIIFGIKDGERYFLGTKETIRRDITGTVARLVMEATPLTTELVGDVSLVRGEYRLVNSGVELYGTVTFPNDVMLVTNGDSFIATTDNGNERYIYTLTDNMTKFRDPVIGSMDIFADVDVMDITLDNITNHYHTSMLLIGGLLIETRKLYTYLGTTSKVRGKVGGWLPTLYKRISGHISPYACGLGWPINLDDLGNLEVFNKIIEHHSSRLIVFNSPTPVCMDEVPIPKVGTGLINGIICYDGRPSPDRVIKTPHSNRAPSKNGLYPDYCDINNGGGKMVFIDHVVKNIPPMEHIPTFVNYEVKS